MDQKNKHNSKENKLFFIGLSINFREQDLVVLLLKYSKCII